MKNEFEKIISDGEKEEIKEFVSVLLLLPKEDRAILLSNANAFKTRRDIAKARQNEVRDWRNYKYLKMKNLEKSEQ